MLFQRVNRSDPEKIFVVVKNGSGATMTASYPAYWDCEMTTPDGVQCTNSATSTTLQTFAGITDADIANGSYGLVQVFGYRGTVPLTASVGTTLSGTPVMMTNLATSAITTSAFAAATAGKYKTFGFTLGAIASSSSSAYATTGNLFIRAL